MNFIWIVWNIYLNIALISLKLWVIQNHFWGISFKKKTPFEIRRERKNKTSNFFLDFKKFIVIIVIRNSSHTNVVRSNDLMDT